MPPAGGEGERAEGRRRGGSGGDGCCRYVEVIGGGMWRGREGRRRRARACARHGRVVGPCARRRATRAARRVHARRRLTGLTAPRKPRQRPNPFQKEKNSPHANQPCCHRNPLASAPLDLELSGPVKLLITMFSSS